MFISFSLYCNLKSPYESTSSTNTSELFVMREGKEGRETEEGRGGVSHRHRLRNKEKEKETQRERELTQFNKRITLTFKKQ